MIWATADYINAKQLKLYVSPPSWAPPPSPPFHPSRSSKHSRLGFPCYTAVAASYLFTKAMAPHSSTLAWKIPWMEEPGRLQSTGSLRVGHDWATSLSRTGEGNGNPLQCSCQENPRDGGAWWAAVCGIAQSRTRLKWLSSSSSSSSSNKILFNSLL